MNFWLGFLAGWLIGTTLGAAAMAFFCGVGRANDNPPADLKLKRMPPSIVGK